MFSDDPSRYTVTLPPSFSEKTTEIVREIGAEVVADAPTILGIGMDTIAAAAGGAGALGIGYGAFRLLKTFISKDRKPAAERSVSTKVANPFPHRLDEARELRELRQHTERRVPEFDAAVGRIIEDEIELHRQFGSDADRSVLEPFWNGVRDRVAKLMPPSTREYHSEE